MPGLIGQVFRTGQGRLVADVAHEPDYVAADPTVVSELLVPIRKEDRVLGVLNLESPRPGRLRRGAPALCGAVGRADRHRAG